MKITAFALKVAKAEKGKKQVNIAQIMDILKAINKLLPKNVFYSIIRGI